MTTNLTLSYYMEAWFTAGYNLAKSQDTDILRIANETNTVLLKKLDAAYARIRELQGDNQ